MSALVHSSTLVTAGVFLLIRFYPLISTNPWLTQTLLFFRVLTILIAGIAAIIETDLKKIIALSTLSQLGIIIASIALSQPILALFHLLTHALFKALLFICAGTLIHYANHSQDLRTIGNLQQQLPVTISIIFIANLALCGFPFLAGFYSKDLILESRLFFSNNSLIVSIIFIATLLTAAYSIRITLSRIVSPSLYSPLSNFNNERPYFSTPALLLCFTAVTGGAALN